MLKHLKRSLRKLITTKSPAMTTATATTITRGFVIRTAFIGPTDHLGAESPLATLATMRDDLRVYVEWDHSIDAEQNHFRAAQTLLNKLNANRADYFRKHRRSRSEGWNV